jgi:cobalt-zinc-cadmium efflux system membrane fusion protein
VDVPPQNMISVSIPLGGYLKSTNMLPGMQVRKGQVLAMVEDQHYIQLQQEYLITLSRKIFAEQELQRQKELNVGRAGSDKALQMAETEHRSLQISAGALAEKLRLIGINPQTLNENNISRQIAVHSPIDGYISKVNRNIGSYINPSDVLFELIDPNNIHLSLTVFEKDLNKLSIGQKVIAFTNNQPDKKYDLEISLISQDLSADRSAEIHCHFEQGTRDLLPGTYMNAEIMLTHSPENTLPENSIVSFEGKQYVFIEKSKLSYEMTEVSVGDTENGFTAIQTDLGKQQIVTNGAYSLLMQLKNVADE